MVKASTRVVLAARNVGLANESPLIIEGTTQEVMKAQIEFLSQQTMANRFEIFICRNRKDLDKALNRRAGDTIDPAQDELTQMIANMVMNLGETQNVQ